MHTKCEQLIKPKGLNSIGLIIIKFRVYSLKDLSTRGSYPRANCHLKNIKYCLMRERGRESQTIVMCYYWTGYI